MHKCKNCRGPMNGKRADAKFCKDYCRTQYWAHHVEPRAVCTDCGTLLGINSLRNIKNGKGTGMCASCVTINRVGVGNRI